MYLSAVTFHFISVPFLLCDSSLCELCVHSSSTAPKSAAHSRTLHRTYRWNYIWEMEMWFRFCFRLQRGLLKCTMSKTNHLFLCCLADTGEQKEDECSTQEKWMLQSHGTHWQLQKRLTACFHVLTHLVHMWKSMYTPILLNIAVHVRRLDRKHDLKYFFSFIVQKQLQELSAAQTEMQVQHVTRLSDPSNNTFQLSPNIQSELSA